MTAIDYVILHHDGCTDHRFHYRIEPNGFTKAIRGQNEQVQHARAIAIVMSGVFETGPPQAAQIEALKTLLFHLRRRHGEVRVAGHREVRGNETGCPGQQFPLREIVAWSRTTLAETLDPSLQRDIDRQYNPLL